MKRSGMTAILSDADYERLRRVIYDECGIKMTPAKKVMLEARLRKRLRNLGIDSFAGYCEYLFSRDGNENELINMIDVVTTNKTDFFREPKHFDFLTSTAVPALIELYGAGMRRNMNIWSAGCSTGEEPYTIAMALSEFRETHPTFEFLILGTDISTLVLEKAQKAIYKMERVDTVPAVMKKKYLLRSRDRQKNLVRIAPEVRKNVRFRRLNFMAEDFEMREPMDLIFCRNVIIYFDRQTQERLLNRLYDHLIPGGYMFMGHSETLSGLNVPLLSVGNMIYRKPL
ncbi:MAG: protein-glutamate O-methyltransferase CheR [Nitrospirae bacterium]|nr:protein-glutamate O-methyltransferase CheR [Nitrospirota bacterium]